MISSSGRPETADGLDRVAELRLLDVVVAPDDGHHEPAVAGHEEGGLGRPARRDVEDPAERLDRGRVGRLDVLHRQERLGLGRRLADARDLLVRGVVAGVAQDERVLAEWVDDHELVGRRPAHDPDVGPDDDRLEPEPLEDPLVGAVLELVAPVQAGPVAVAAVGVLHHELADADEPAPGPRLVAELRLEVVDDHRQLAVAPDEVLEQERDDLFVGHREDHVPVAAVLEPDQLRADLEVAPALLPDLGRVDDRHLHLLAADPIDLLADDLLDPVAHALAERQQRVDPGAELAQIAGPDEQAVRRHLGVGRIVAERGEEQVAQAHGR